MTKTNERRPFLLLFSFCQPVPLPLSAAIATFDEKPVAMHGE